jgi:beta-alanine--pyruvate transaminase
MSGVINHHYWLPFTANRAFHRAPRLIAAAEGCYYRSDDGRRIYDSLSGLWCCGAGHCHPEIVAAIARQAGTLDYAPAFQHAHPLAFQLAERLASLTPPGSTMCSSLTRSERRYRHRWRAPAGSRGRASKTRLIGRARLSRRQLGGTMRWNERQSQGIRPLPEADHLAHAAARQRLHARHTARGPNWRMSCCD